MRVQRVPAAVVPMQMGTVGGWGGRVERVERMTVGGWRGVVERRGRGSGRWGGGVGLVGATKVVVEVSGGGGALVGGSTGKGAGRRALVLVDVAVLGAGGGRLEALDASDCEAGALEGAHCAGGVVVVVGSCWMDVEGNDVSGDAEGMVSEAHRAA